MATLDILLATYNGARFLPDQLASLEAQSFTDWRLILRDDGSNDDSVTVVRDWASRTGRSLQVIEDGRQGLGPRDNFAALIANSTAPYFALCDQDDVWLPNKLAIMLAAVQAGEQRSGPDTPVLAICDLKVVDSQLQELHPSYRGCVPLVMPRPDYCVTDIMTYNVVTGCASMCNAALRTASLPIPAEAIMHDWWLGMVAAGFGELVDVPDALVLYRQHESNVVGAAPKKWRDIFRRFLTNTVYFKGSFEAFIEVTRLQSLAFHRRFGDSPDNHLINAVGAYANSSNLSFWTRKRLVIDYIIRNQPFMRNFGMLAFV